MQSNDSACWNSSGAVRLFIVVFGAFFLFKILLFLNQKSSPVVISPVSQYRSKGLVQSAPAPVMFSAEYAASDSSSSYSELKEDAVRTIIQGDISSFSPIKTAQNVVERIIESQGKIQLHQIQDQEKSVFLKFQIPSSTQISFDAFLHTLAPAERFMKQNIAVPPSRGYYSPLTLQNKKETLETLEKNRATTTQTSEIIELERYILSLKEEIETLSSVLDQKVDIVSYIEYSLTFSIHPLGIFFENVFSYIQTTFFHVLSFLFEFILFLLFFILPIALLLWIVFWIRKKLIKSS